MNIEDPTFHISCSRKSYKSPEEGCCFLPGCFQYIGILAVSLISYRWFPPHLFLASGSLDFCSSHVLTYRVSHDFRSLQTSKQDSVPIILVLCVRTSLWLQPASSCFFDSIIGGRGRYGIMAITVSQFYSLDLLYTSLPSPVSSLIVTWVCVFLVHLTYSSMCV